ncbi:hypothetical protein GCM10022252_54770 [Streptosporangium oxazolinicum]|uniref:Guanylate cyclase domain-containing protein n=1 Tax=Streptosporangium oxazolinicum TaxID=909287 RepID=A0ABP8B942_9ACTN
MDKHAKEGTRPLPAYRGIFAVDCVRFSDNPSLHLPDLSARIPDVLKTAFDRCGIPEVWAQRRFPQATGDGYVFGVRPKHLPFLIDPLLHRLQEVLWEEAPSLRSRNRKLGLRLRVSVHVGPVPDEGDELRDRIGTPTIDTFRLLDSTSLREALRGGQPDITLLGAIVSQRVFDDVVKAGYTGLHPSEFRPVTADVPGKDFVQPAWIYIPKRSYDDGEPAPRPRGTAPEPVGPVGGSTTAFHGDVGNAITGGSFSSDVNMTGNIHKKPSNDPGNKS